MNGRDLAEYCIEFASNLGAQYTEARYEKSMTRGFVYRNGAPISGGQQPLAGIGVRFLVDGNFGFASFDRMDRNIAESAIGTAFKMAKNTKRKEPIDIGNPVSNKARWEVEVKKKLADVDIDTIMDTAKLLNEQMKDLVSYTLILNPMTIEKFIITNEGTKIDARLSRIISFVLLTAKGKVGSEQKYLDMTLVGGWERIKETNLVEYLGNEVQRLQRAAEEAKLVKDVMGKPIDMIVGSEVAGIIAHENVGHPSEGDRIKGREGAQAGESFWRDLTFGESRVGSDAVTVSEDPTIPFTSGYYEYDDEGVKSRKRTLIKNGIINEPLLNREFGVKFGKESNAAARSVAYNREPIIRMANTFFEPGSHSFDEIVDDVKLGVYMRSFQEWNIDDRRFQSKYTGSEAYLIKNGEVTNIMVRRPIMETTSVGLLSAVDAVTNNLKLDFPATCAKGDPAQGIPVYAGGGEIRFRDIILGGVG